MYHYESCGLDNIYLANGYNCKKTAYGPSTSIHDLFGLHKVIAKGIVDKNLVITPKEFRFLRIELDISQKAIALLMGKTDQIIAKWEKGTSDIPVLADKAIRDLYMHSIGEEQAAGILERLAEVDRHIHELELNLEETAHGWDVQQAI